MIEFGTKEDTSVNKTMNESNLQKNHREGNPDTGDPTDGRKRYDWTSHYPDQAKKEIHLELCYLFLVFFTSLFLIFATWKGWTASLLNLSLEEAFEIKKYAYYASSGMLGGITFGMKYFYRTVARGWWHLDRRPWRIMSPFIAMTVSLIIGIMFNSTVESVQKPNNTPTVLLFGFLAGYFADEAVGKMYELAEVIFGRTKIKNG